MHKMKCLFFHILLIIIFFWYNTFIILIYIKEKMMEPLFTTQILKYKGKDLFTCDDTLVREIKLEIFINDEKVGALMATPVDE